MDNLFFSLDQLKALGTGVIIGKTVRIRKPECCTIGDYAILDDFLYISCALAVGCFTHIGANGSLIGGQQTAHIGAFVNIAPGCQIVCGSHDFTEGGLAGPTIPAAYQGASIAEDVTLHDHVLLGCQTVVLPGAVLPEGMATGAMTLVTQQQYEPWTLYVGVPARPVRRRQRETILAQTARLQQALISPDGQR